MEEYSMDNNTIYYKQVLETMIRHETLTIDDLAKEENLGFVPNTGDLITILYTLCKNGFLKDIPGATKLTYTITQKGIEEGLRLRQTAKNLK